MTASRRVSVAAILAWPFRAVWLNLKLLALSVLSRPIGTSFAAGDLLIVRRPLAVTVLTHWRAPYTDGFHCLLPEGTRLRVSEATGRRARGLPCQPDDLEAFESAFVSEDVRRHAKYAGCSLVLVKGEVAACEVVVVAAADRPGGGPSR